MSLSKWRDISEAPKDTDRMAAVLRGHVASQRVTDAANINFRELAVAVIQHGCRWHDIESAPKDGTPTLITALGWAWPRLAYWNSFSGAWYDNTSGSLAGEPTHFMELPDPPS